jgi:two-component system KDP operon response regulator KdpE
MMAAGVPGQVHGTPAHGNEPQDAPTPGAEIPTPLSRVLVVEDEPAMLRALRINLRVRGYDVTTARTAAQALTEAGRRPPGAVILDLGLPDIDGIEVIRGLRGWSRAPVIVLSGRTSSGDKIAALDAGADDYVTKPFSMEELLARLRAALRRDDGTPPAARVSLPFIDTGRVTPAMVRSPSTRNDSGVPLTLAEVNVITGNLRAHGSRYGSPPAAARGTPHAAGSAHW